VILVLPEVPTPLAARDLVYTAITRARVGLGLWCRAERLHEAVLRPSARASVLGERLRGKAGGLGAAPASRPDGDIAG